ncbi:hypothetical protein ACI3L3_13340 [Desulfobaculum sp. SPO524]|uniref:hypothetical protein n=1 Tax=Desulfobaculum sp. SPO524 TaxID=3378071 RepID=UPI00385292E3
MMKHIVLAVLLVGLVAGCSVATRDSQREKSTMLHSVEALRDAVEQHDVEKIRTYIDLRHIVEQAVRSDTKRRLEAGLPSPFGHPYELLQKKGTQDHLVTMWYTIIKAELRRGEDTRYDEPIDLWPYSVMTYQRLRAMLAEDPEIREQGGVHHATFHIPEFEGVAPVDVDFVMVKSGEIWRLSSIDNIHSVIDVFATSINN